MQPGNDKLKIWKKKHQEFRKSGMTRRAYCQKIGVKESTLDYWFSRIRKLGKAQGFVEVHPLPTGTRTATMVVTTGRFRIELSDPATVVMLTEVVKALESLG